MIYVDIKEDYCENFQYYKENELDGTNIGAVIYAFESDKTLGFKANSCRTSELFELLLAGQVEIVTLTNPWRFDTESYGQEGPIVNEA